MFFFRSPYAGSGRAVAAAGPAASTQRMMSWWQIVIFTAGITKSVRPRDRICISAFTGIKAGDQHATPFRDRAAGASWFTSVS
jgi:hypothetical protein